MKLRLRYSLAKLLATVTVVCVFAWADSRFAADRVAREMLVGAGCRVQVHGFEPWGIALPIFSERYGRVVAIDFEQSNASGVIRILPRLNRLVRARFINSNVSVFQVQSLMEEMPDLEIE